MHGKLNRIRKIHSVFPAPPGWHVYFSVTTREPGPSAIHTGKVSVAAFAWATIIDTDGEAQDAVLPLTNGLWVHNGDLGLDLAPWAATNYVGVFGPSTDFDVVQKLAEDLETERKEESDG